MTRRHLLSLLAPTPRPWLLGANTAVQGYGLYEAIDLIRRLDFPVIEIHPMGRPEPTPKAFPGFRFDELTPADRRKLRGALRTFQLISTHLPYTGLNWLSPDPAIKQKAIHTIDTALEGSAYCGARLAVLHPQTLSSEPFPPRQAEYIELIRRWADRVHKLGLRLAIETGFPNSVDAFVSLVQAVDHPQVGATVDVGHQGRFAELIAQVQPEDRAKPASIKAYNDTTLEIISRLGPKLFHLHVHDIDPSTWVEHKPLQHGFVDYPRLFAQLHAIKYTGALVLEIGGDPLKMPTYLRDARDQLRRWLTPN